MYNYRDYTNYQRLNEKYIYGYLREHDDRYGNAGTFYYIGQGTKKRVIVEHTYVNVPKNKKMIVIFEDNITSQEYADNLEKNLISYYGRIDKNTGILENRTIGGSGWGVSGKVAVKDEHGDIFMVSVDDSRYLSGELIHATKGVTRNTGYLTVRDRSGNTLRVHKDDSRFKSGELVHHTTGVPMNIGFVVAKDSDGNRYRVMNNDQRLVTGELVGINKGRISEKRDSKIYCFERIDTGEKVEMTQSDFAKSYNIHPGSTSRLVNKKSNTAQGWKLSD
jgi:hypothetical protein